jgi:alpha-1,2-mannosyltransferase
VAEWQTRWLQVPVSERAWGFKSPLAHIVSCLRTWGDTPNLRFGVSLMFHTERNGGVVVVKAPTSPRGRVTVRDAVLTMVAIAAVLCLHLLRWSGLNSGGWVDLDVYVRGAQAVVAGTPLYELHGGVLPFTYSPFAAVLFTPLLLLDADAGRWVFTAGSVVSYLVAVGVFGRRLRLPGRHLAIVALAGLALEPVVRSILLGQVNLYLIAAVAVDCHLVKPRHRGWLVGLAAGVKIVPGVFVLFFILQRDWRSALRAACGFLVTVAGGALVAPQDSAGYWSGGLFGISHWGPVAVVDGKNQSLIGQLARVSYNPSPLMVTALVVTVAGLALGMAAARRQLRLGNDVAALTAIAIGGLLASPLSWTHHWVWAIPAAMVLVSRRRWVMAWLLAAVYATGSARGVLLQPGQDSLTLLEQLASATYVAAGTGLLAAWALGRRNGVTETPPLPVSATAGPPPVAAAR